MMNSNEIVKHYLDKLQECIDSKAEILVSEMCKEWVSEINLINKRIVTFYRTNSEKPKSVSKGLNEIIEKAKSEKFQDQINDYLLKQYTENVLQLSQNVVKTMESLQKLGNKSIDDCSNLILEQFDIDTAFMQSSLFNNKDC